MDRPVAALDDGGRAVEVTQKRDDFRIVAAIAFGEENVAGAAETFRRLPQRPAREHEVVSKRRGAIHEHDVELAAQLQILQAIVEEVLTEL